MPEDTKNIFINYDNKLIYHGISCLISSKPYYVLLGGVEKEDSLFAELQKRENIDILIIEKTILGESVITNLENVINNFPGIKVLLLASSCNICNIDKFLDTGIYSFMLKTCGKEDMFIALSHLAEGKKYFCSNITQLMHKEFVEKNHNANSKSLTARELEVLKYFVNGDCNKQIADKINISESTVKTHRKNLMLKFGSNNLISMLRYACRENMIDFGMTSFCKCCPYKLN